MIKIKVFISSVQSEFSEERRLLFDYLATDSLLGRFFDPFIFENLPAVNHAASTVFNKEVEHCDIYLGLLGKMYGHEDQDGISPTEREFDHAGLHHKTRLVFLSNHQPSERHPKEADLINKAEQVVVRKKFTSFSDLKSAVYASLVRYLEEKEYIRTGPFDATLNPSASIDDLDKDKITEFIHVARAKRGFPLPDDSTPETILTHLNLLANGRFCNAAILLFGKQPQRFFISSEIKCAHFHGFDVVKPIPAYQVYKGDVFQLVNQAVDFVLSKIDVSVGTRDVSSQVPINYELPPAAVSEAIVNAIAHRDYTSNGSVQVMLFKDRLEIWNPGNLPFGLNTAKLRQPHSSIPANPLLAEPMYLAGYIERLGTGTGDIIRLCKEKGLKEPDFIQDEEFKTVLWRTLSSTEQPTGQPTDQVTGQATGQVTSEATGQAIDGISRMLLVIDGEMKSAEIQSALQLKHRENFRDNYLMPSMEEGLVEMTVPDKPNHPNQHYRLTVKGLALKKKLRKSEKKK